MAGLGCITCPAVRVFSVITGGCALWLIPYRVELLGQGSSKRCPHGCQWCGGGEVIHSTGQVFSGTPKACNFWMSSHIRGTTGLEAVASIACLATSLGGGCIACPACLGTFWDNSRLWLLAKSRQKWKCCVSRLHKEYYVEIISEPYNSP